MRCRLLLGILALIVVTACQPATPTPPPRPAYVAASAKEVFSDHFTEAALDTTKWRNNLPWYPESGGIGADHSSLEWNQPSQVSLSGNALHLTAAPAAGSNAGGKPYVSGCLTTAGKFAFTYGYVEFRARVPAGKGLWPALWLLPTDESWPPEIDAMESIGDPTQVSLTYHGTTNSAPGVDLTGLATGWHTYGISWQPTGVTWYVDGVQKFHVADSPSKPMYLIVNLSVGGDWPGAPDATTKFPTSFDISDVTVWQ